MGSSLIGPKPLAGLGTSPRASAASDSCTITGNEASRRARSANPMWSLWPCVSNTARTSASERPIRSSAAGRSFQYEGTPASMIVTCADSSTR
jgi:hypothetical protein